MAAVLPSPDGARGDDMIIVLGVMAVIGGGFFLMMTGENRTRRPQKAGITPKEPKQNRVSDLD